ncbi:hypothetical protein V1505DRAFT_382033 [Lipomyces doorenjongii]
MNIYNGAGSLSRSRRIRPAIAMTRAHSLPAAADEAVSSPAKKPRKGNMVRDSRNRPTPDKPPIFVTTLTLT